MLPRITCMNPEKDYCLRVLFDDGKRVLYDMKMDMQTLPGYSQLMKEELFLSVKLDASRTCVIWTDEIDLPSDILYEYGVELEAAGKPEQVQ